MSIRVRFAPSPTGMPHVGVIRTAIFDWLLARHHNGKFVLRIEDTDRSRYVEGAVDNIIGALKWLGMDIDEGPSAGGDYGPYYQSERLPLYYRYVKYLIDEGRAYWCNCTPERLDKIRKEQQAKKMPVGYDNKCWNLGLNGEPGDGVHVLRFAIPPGMTTTFHDELRGDITVDNDELDDFVLLKRDGFPTYHFASCIDDHHMAISHVFRGEEWLSSAPKHKLLYDALGIEPPKFVHVPVILGPDRKKLSKRHGAANVLEYKQMGYLPEAIFNFLALIGWNPGTEDEILSKEQLAELFTVERINTSAGIFDIDKLNWMNGEYIRAMPLESLVERLRPAMSEWGWIDDGFEPWGKEYVAGVCALMQERLKTLVEMREKAFFFFEEFESYDPKGAKKAFKGDDIIDRLSAAREKLEKTEWTVVGIEAAIRETAEKFGVGAGKIIHPIRLAVSGISAGPGLFEMLHILGRKKVIARIDKAIESL